VFNAAFGHRTNETLGRVLSALVGQRAGSSVAMEVDPYRIELEVPSGISGPEVARTLEGIEPEHVRSIVELSLNDADALGFKLAQVAAKFGALDPDRDAEFGRRRLLEALEDTPVHDEAVRELLHEDLDVEGAADVIRRLRAGEIDLVTVGERTAVGTGGRSSGRELLAPENADASVIRRVRDRLQDDDVRLLCVHCGEWSRETQVKRVPDQPDCPRCESTRVAALSPWAEAVVEAVRTAPDARDGDQEEAVERAYRNANLVQSHGRQAVIALAARGVGPHNAARIIAKLREDEDDFYRDILRQERQYARTRSFWD